MGKDELFRRYPIFQQYVDWTEADARRVHAVEPLLAPAFAAIVADFHAEIERHPEAHRVITGGAEQVERLKTTLTVRLRELLSGRYDGDYILRRWQVGYRHVDIGLSLVYTNAALSRLRLRATDLILIAVADDEPEMRDYLRETLTVLGHQVVSVAQSGAELLEHCRQHRPDLVITDIKMPGLDGIEAATQICRSDSPAPVILVSAYHDPDLIERAIHDHVMAYLVKPIKQANLETAIALAMTRFREFLALHAQAESLRQALEDRKLIERAKGALMRRAGLNEPNAFRRLQRLSSEKNLKLVEIAKAIVLTDEAIQGP